MGHEAQVIKLENKEEFHHISGVLKQMELNSSFWLGNAPQESSEVASWAPCQPGMKRKMD